MSVAGWRPSLGEHFLSELTPSLVRGRPLGDYETSLGAAIFGGAWVFSRAALVGRGARDRLDALAEMLRVRRAVIGGGSVGDALQQMARETVAELRAAPRSLAEFWLATEYPTVVWSDDRLASLAGQTLPLESARRAANLAAVAGVAVGATFPDAIDFLWRGAQAQEAPGPWRRAAIAGVPLERGLESASLPDAQADALAAVTSLARAHYPHALAQLVPATPAS